MNTHAAAFVSGAATAAAALIYSGVHGPAAAFVYGFLLAAVVLVGALSSRRRLRAAAGFLNRLAGGRQSIAAPAAKREPVSQVERDVVAALVQLGCDNKAAAAAARRSIENNPARDFDGLFRSALQFSKA